ncbi:MAG: acetyltransferase, partial [Microbacteriaceae bacterium]
RRRARARAGVAAVLVLALAAMTGIGVLTAPARTATETAIAAGESAIAAASDDSATDATTDATGDAEAGTAATGQITGDQITGDQITAIGDSVMLAVAPSLQQAFPGIDIHAAVSRQASAGVKVIRRLAERDELRGVLLIGLGTNGLVSTAALDAMIAAAPAGVRVVLVTVQAPRSWTADVNATLRDYAAAHAGVVVADWHRAIHGKLSCLGPDRIHPTSTRGGTVYARTVQQALDALADDG